jgi:hypothetical protein
MEVRSFFAQVEQSIFGPDVKQSAVLEWSVGGAVAVLSPAGERRPVLLSLSMECGDSESAFGAV